VLANLAVNARDAMPEGGDVEISVRTLPAPPSGREGDWVCLAVRDGGMGIPLELQAKVFDPFFTTKPVGVGTGLGLSICHSIVTAFGGELTVESEEGKGSTFRVSLPSARRTADTGERRAPALRLPEVARILLVDAEPALAKAMRRVLSGHKVETTASGLEALALCQERPFDLVLYDVMTPDLLPLDMYRRLQETGSGAERRLAFTSAGALPPEVTAFINETPVPCLDKPFDAAEVEHLLQTR